MNDLEIIIPAYNEEETIAEVVNGIRKALANPCRIIVVDDGSQDRTAEIAQSCGAEVVIHPYHIGNGASIKTGLRKARAEVV
ncbi:MAG: glycosyltransferase family 2 protein, partial [Candidatus Omnitrophota bacterium]